MSIASIPGASESLVALLKDQLAARLAPDPVGFDVQLFRSGQFTGPPSNVVSLLLYRVDVDEARRNVESPAGTMGRSSTGWLGLELSYLLTVWGSQSAVGEQEMLQHCMEILQRFAILKGPQLDPKYAWEPEDALRVSLAAMNHEDLMRLWDGFDLPYQLSVPYLVRTVRLAPRESGDGLVGSRALAVGSRVSP
jgi:hypothetical protein